ncbi:hypothetical protein BC833DRAFT_611443 [Globomyces pollinis-pini]|nr:hypothetical protein BC833DRAFT_611443 [Globomyces pollinis-pini]
MWITVAISIPLNVIKMAIVIAYSERGFVNDWKGAYKILWWYYVVNIFVYFTQHIALYQRKKVVRPEKYYIDEIMLVLLCIFSTIGNLACIIDINGCWAIASNIILVSLVLSFLYFDIYYCYKVITLYGSQSSTFSKQILVVLPVWWTVSNTFVYGYGSVVYGMGKADFYTNALWNLACLLVPVVAIQSNIATNVGSFVKESSIGGKTGKPSSTSKAPTKSTATEK